MADKLSYRAAWMFGVAGAIFFGFFLVYVASAARGFWLGLFAALMGGCVFLGGSLFGAALVRARIADGRLKL